MNRNFKLSLALIFCFINVSISQIQHLQKNPDIVWLAESFSNCDLDKNVKKIDFKYVDCENVLMKYVHEKGFNDFQYSLDSFFSFKQIMIGIALDNNSNIYHDHNLENKTSANEIKELKLRDSIISFDPETFKEVKTPNFEELQAKDILYFKIKQFIFYNSKTKEIQTQPVAIAPIIKIKENLHDLFWLPIESNTKIDLHNKNLKWINRINYNVFIVEMEELKEKLSFLDIWNNLYSTINDTTIKHDYYLTLRHSPSSNLLLYKIPNEILVDLNIQTLSVDTVITFDPETFAEIVRVYKYGIEYDFFEGIKIYQDWAWDEKKKKLIVNSKGFSPIYTKYLINGKLEEGDTPTNYIVKLTNR